MSGGFKYRRGFDKMLRQVEGRKSKGGAGVMDYGVWACYCRRRFPVDDPASNDDLALSMIYRGGRGTGMNRPLMNIHDRP